MKNRRLTITAFLLCAILVLGVGFAALADRLDINGTVEISGTQAESTFDGDVHFDVDGFDAEDDVVKTGSTHHTENATAGGNVVFSADGDTATFMSTTFADAGDKTAITFTIVNEFAQAVKVTATITYTNNTGDIFTATITGTGWTNNVATIAAKDGSTNGTTTFTLTVELTEVPQETVNATVKVQFDVEIAE